MRLRCFWRLAAIIFYPAQGFWRRRLRYALDYRKTVMGPDYACCRLIFGEADQFPGLTVDRFGDILVTEVLSLGMEVRKDLLYPCWWTCSGRTG